MEDWKNDLGDMFKNIEEKGRKDEENVKKREAEAEKFFTSIVIPAFEELKNELEKHGREVSTPTGYKSVYSQVGAIMSVKFEGVEEYVYGIGVKISPRCAFPYSERWFTSKEDGKKYKGEGVIRSGVQDYDVSDISKEDIIRDFLSGYKLHVGGVS